MFRLIFNYKALVLSALCVFIFTDLQAADLKNGQSIAKRVCAACHGKQGISRAPVFPNLSGQKEAYLLKQLHDFKSGERASNNMSGVVKNLSEQDKQDVAAYFSGHGKIADTTAKVSKSLQKKVADKLTICMPCHNSNGISKSGQFPNLAGQKQRYLQKELEKFKKGRRKNASMSAIIEQLDKKDIKYLSKYFAKAGKIEIQK